MQSPNEAPSNNTGRSAHADRSPQLNVVLVYEDLEMGVQGKGVFDLMAREAGGEGAARLTLWRFDFFTSAELTLAVSRQAEEADVIIIAPRNPHSLPPNVKSWLERWPQNRRREMGALVAVFHPAVSAIAESSNTALLLWRAASRAEMDFICRTPTAHSANSVVSPAVTATTTTGSDPSATFTGDFPTGSTGWGLND
jgi:hypothetical protein